MYFLLPLHIQIKLEPYVWGETQFISSCTNIVHTINFYIWIGKNEVAFKRFLKAFTRISLLNLYEYHWQENCVLKTQSRYLFLASIYYRSVFRGFYVLNKTSPCIYEGLLNFMRTDWIRDLSSVCVVSIIIRSNLVLTVIYLGAVVLIRRIRPKNLC